MRLYRKLLHFTSRRSSVMLYLTFFNQRISSAAAVFPAFGSIPMAEQLTA